LKAGYPAAYRILQIDGYPATFVSIIYLIFIRTLPLGFGGFLSTKIAPYKVLKRKKIINLFF
jgi:hypothetical protein